MLDSCAFLFLLTTYGKRILGLGWIKTDWWHFPTSIETGRELKVLHLVIIVLQTPIKQVLIWFKYVN